MEKQTENNTQMEVKSPAAILRALKVGESTTFPNTQYSAAQGAKTRVSIECDMILVSSYDRVTKTLTIYRTA